MLQPITAADVQEASRAAKNTAGGMDGWQPEDFNMLSPAIYQAIADLMNTIEAGAPWPKATMHARAAFLDKAPTRDESTVGTQVRLVDPTQYRLLLIMSVLLL